MPIESYKKSENENDDEEGNKFVKYDASIERNKTYS